MAPKKKKVGIKTKTPEKVQIGDVEDIEGIGPEYAKLLKKIGIKTTEDLRKQSLVQVTEETDISTKLIYKWQCMADLFRVRRAAEEYTEFLFEMGIETVKELSKQDVDELEERVKDFYEEVKDKPGWQAAIKKLPTRKDIELWISSAKELLKVD
ncbi:MAG: DUF4332 domain-containing protein [Candidatus Helarchaeota archaeon]|nr:DUF4332 domain-containing protein [Candidatus Helarchaeota archaeon]